MQSTERDESAYGLLSKVTTVATLLLASPFVAVAFVPMTLMLLPVAFIGWPFMLAAFFGETKALRPAQPVPQLRPRLAV